MQFNLKIIKIKLLYCRITLRLILIFRNKGRFELIRFFNNKNVLKLNLSFILIKCE